MVAVILVGLLAVAAIPQYLDMRRKALRAEPLPHLRAIAIAEQAHYAASGDWVELPPSPMPPVGSDLRSLAATGGWSQLAWHPEGEVRCSYSAVTLDGGAHVRAQAVCDLDRDQNIAILRLDVPSGDQPGVLTDVFPERY